MYIPKNKIQTNLYTSDEYVDDARNPYTGYYYKLYNGTFFTGRYPGEIPNSVQLYPSIDGPTYNIDEKANVFKLFPTPNDYKIGYFTRYFIKRRNQLLYFELEIKDASNENIK